MAAKDAKEKELALPEGQAEKPKKKSRKLKIVIILTILIMILGGGGAGAYWWFFMRSPVSETSAETPAVAEQKPANEKTAQETNKNAPADSSKVERPEGLPRSSGLVLPLPPITLNLDDPNGRRYLKLGLEVEVNSDVASQLKAANPRIRDAIIMLLAGKTYADISTADGKVLLKAEIAARLNQILGAQRIVRVYFTDFVVE